jgi:hypothetical protein
MLERVTVIGALYFRLMNNELENIAKEAIVTSMKKLSEHLFGESEQNITKIIIQINPYLG